MTGLAAVLPSVAPWVALVVVASLLIAYLAKQWRIYAVEKLPCRHCGYHNALALRPYDHSTSNHWVPHVGCTDASAVPRSDDSEGRLADA